MARIVGISFNGSHESVRRTLRKCAMKGWIIREDSRRIQAALDKAARQEATRQVLAPSSKTRGGIA